ncbi:hypothetical protein [Nodularia harveyana]
MNLPDKIQGEEITITIEKEVNHWTRLFCGQITHSIHQNHWGMIHYLP